MTEQAFCTLAGFAVAGLEFTGNPSGPWYADVDLEGDDDVTGSVALVCNGATLACTVDPERSGSFGLQRKLRVVAGADGWRNIYPAKGYQSDAGVKARAVVDDLAKLTGERIGDFTPAAAVVGDTHYDRPRGSAGSVLEQIAGGVPWWVDYAGVTHVRARAVAPAASDTYEVLNFDARSRVAEVAIDDLTAIGVGSVLTDRLDAPQIVQSFTVTLTGRSLRMIARCGDTPKAGSTLSAVVDRLVSFFVDRKLLGKYRYRVVRMAADGRVDVQAVRRNGRTPDAILLPQWPGVAGAHTELSEGSIVAVEFLEGHPGLPVITNYQGIQGTSYAPKRTYLGGKAGAREAAFKGSATKALFPPMVINGIMTVGGTPTPFVGTGVCVTGQILGIVETGEPAVQLGTGGS